MTVLVEATDRFRRTTPTPHAPLRRGRPPDVRVRELGDGEVDVLEAVFAGLSERSRYLRFHGATPRLTAGMRRALTAVDGRRHMAMVAVAGGAPVGIARLVAVDADRVELAIEVVDAWQGRGIGRRLLEAVAERGRHAGYRELVADTLTENHGIRLLIGAVLPVVSTRLDGPNTRLVAALHPADADLTALTDLTDTLIAA